MKSDGCCSLCRHRHRCYRLWGDFQRHTTERFWSVCMCFVSYFLYRLLLFAISIVMVETKWIKKKIKLKKTLKHTKSDYRLFSNNYLRLGNSIKWTELKQLESRESKCDLFQCRSIKASRLHSNPPPALLRPVSRLLALVAFQRVLWLGIICEFLSTSLSCFFTYC